MTLLSSLQPGLAGPSGRGAGGGRGCRGTCAHPGRLRGAAVPRSVPRRRARSCQYHQFTCRLVTARQPRSCSTHRGPPEPPRVCCYPVAPWPPVWTDSARRGRGRPMTCWCTACRCFMRHGLLLGVLGGLRVGSPVVQHRPSHSSCPCRGGWQLVLRGADGVEQADCRRKQRPRPGRSPPVGVR